MNHPFWGTSIFGNTQIDFEYVPLLNLPGPKIFIFSITRLPLHQGLHPCQAGFVALFAGCHPASLAGKTGENWWNMVSIFWLRVRNWGKKHFKWLVRTNSYQIFIICSENLDMENGHPGSSWMLNAHRNFPALDRSSYAGVDPNLQSIRWCWYKIWVKVPNNSHDLKENSPHNGTQVVVVLDMWHHDQIQPEIHAST